MTDQVTNPTATDTPAIDDFDAGEFEGSLSVDSAADALVSAWDKKEQGATSQAQDPETVSDPEIPNDGAQDDGAEGTTDGEGEEGSEGEGEGEETEGETGDEEVSEPVAVADDVKVKVKVDGAEQEFSVGELKRLAGQEAALTRKSQEVADSRKQATELITAQETALDAMLQRALKRFEPYKDLDLNLAAQELEPDVYKALRDDAQEAFSDVQFYQNELRAAVGRKEQMEQVQLRDQAQKTLTELADPDKGIPGFDRDLFLKMRDYAISQGAPEQAVDRSVDPITWRVIHKAMLYDQAQAKGAAPATQKSGKVVTRTGTQVPTSSRVPAKPSKPNTAAQLKRVRATTGLDSVEAAAQVLLERWG